MSKDGKDKQDEGAQLQAFAEDDAYMAAEYLKDGIASKVRKALANVNPDGEFYKEIVAELLGRIDPKKPFGTKLYLQISRLSWGDYIESVALRVNAETGRVEVFMTQRDESDPDWKGYWHVPGTALRPGDAEEDPKARLAKEYGVPIRSLKRVGDTGFGWFKEGDEGRGPGISFVHITVLDGEPMLNERRGWFPVDNLPTPTVPSHTEKIIPIAVRSYLAR